jgi:hypothetical protein
VSVYVPFFFCLGKGRPVRIKGKGELGVDVKEEGTTDVQDRQTT